MSDIPERIDAFRWEDPERTWHVERYTFAIARLGKKVRDVVDAACGTGFGTFLLKTAGHKAQGVDNSKEALDYVKKTYPDVPCSKLDLNKIDELDHDVVTCFETLEHLQDPKKFLSRVWTRDLFLSVPVIPSKHFNPHHLHDFTENEIVNLLKSLDFTVYEVKRQMYQVQAQQVIIHASRVPPVTL